MYVIIGKALITGRWMTAAAWDGKRWSDRDARVFPSRREAQKVAKMVPQDFDRIQVLHERAW